MYNIELITVSFTEAVEFMNMLTKNGFETIHSYNTLDKKITIKARRKTA